MGLPSYIGSRVDWDAEQERQLRAAFPCDDEGFRQAWNRRYPITVAGAIAELKHRGLKVHEDNLARYCDLESVQRIGRNYIFYPADIDRLAETLAEANKFSVLALGRKNKGISYAEELEGLRHVLDTRRRKAAEAAGVSFNEMIAAIRSGGIPDPAYKRIGVAELKAWFEANAQNSKYQQELQLQETK